MRYIDAELIDETCDWYEHEFPECEYIIRLIQEDIRKMPSVEIKRGRWEEKAYEFHWGNITTFSSVTDTVCSVCGERAIEYMESPYCPWCGAKMDEVKE